MTVVKKLRLKGFKSFASPTELEFGNAFNCVIGSNGSGKCVLGDTLVSLADGSLIKIEDLVNKRLEINSVKTEDGYLALGDNTQILALDLNELKIKSKQIQAFVKRKSPEKLIKIITRSGRCITSTKYHPLFILNEGEVKPIKAEDLKEGVRIAVPRTIKILPNSKHFFELLDLIKAEDKIYVPFSEIYVKIIKGYKEENNLTWNELIKKFKLKKYVLKGLFEKQAINFAYLIKILRKIGTKDIEIIKLIPQIKSIRGGCVYNMIWENSKEFSRFLGYLFAEGCIPKDSGQIRFVNSNQEMIEDYKNLVHKLYNENVTINNYKENSYDILFYSEPIRRILNKFGLPFGPVDFKDLTNLFLQHSSIDELREFLNSFFSGDGYVGDNCLEVSTKSKKLGFALETLMLRLGLTFSSKWKIKICTNSKTKASGIYRVITLYGIKNFRKFSSLINLIHEEKREKLFNLINKEVKSNPNVDLIEANKLVKRVAGDFKLNVKSLTKDYPKLGAYIYNQCLTSRSGLNQLIYNVFTENVISENLEQLKKLVKSDILWDEIIEIEELDSKEEWVYDLCVEKDHNFIANNMIVHNSNILDGMVFVLGELSAKAIRAEKSANLIFNGGKTGSPYKEAEVSIFFDNEKREFPVDSDEIKLSRFVRQNGQSIYKINDEKRTRQQVLELMRAAKVSASHNIISQGDIIAMAEMKPEERRKIIEEVSGISAYEERKEKSLQELGKVDQKLNEANIILKEREVHLRELKKDRDQALKFREIEESLKNNKATLLNFEIKDKEEKKLEVENKINSYQNDINKINAKAEEIKNSIKNKKDEIKNINSQIEERGEKEQIKIQKEIEELKTSLVKDKTRLDNYEIEIKKVRERINQLKQSNTELNQKIDFLNREKKTLEEKNLLLIKKENSLKEDIEKFKKSHDIAEDNSIDKIEKEIEEKQDKLLKTKEERGLKNLEKEKNESQLNSLSGIILSDNKKEIKDLREKFRDITKELNQKVGENAVISSQLSSLRNKLIIANEELIKLKARNITIKESLTGSLSIQKILSLKLKGVYGTVADLGKADSKYSLALEVAAGQRINSLVVKDDEIAAKCIEILKENKLGVATFMPLNKIQSRPIRDDVKKLSSSKGVNGLALDLISYPSELKNIFSFVFGDTLIVDDVDTARKIGVGRARMVTLEGDLFDQSGVIVGGYRAKKLGAFKEKHFDDEINKFEKESNNLKENIKTLEDKKLQLEDQVIKFKDKKAEFEAEIIKFERTYQISDISKIREDKDKLSSNIKQVLSELKNLDNLIITASKELESLKERKEKIKENGMRNPEIMSNLKKLDESREEIRIQTAKNETELKNILNQINTIYAPEKEKTEKIIKDHEKEITQFSEELLKLKTLIDSNSRLLKEKEHQEKQFFSEFKSMFSKRNNLNEDIQKHESLISTEQFKQKEIESRMNELSIKRAKIVAEFEALQKEFEQFSDAKIRRSVTPEQLKTEISEFEKEVKKIGNVNLRALEVYERIEKEYQSLLEKADIISTEKEDILKLMYEIEGKKQSIFMKTFKEVNENFRKIFLSLTEKGEAHLDLEDKENPFNAGMDIKVKLLGNKYLDIKSLSGGEKTLTALAFIFAIQEVRPASFYLMDEIDAALDKSNSLLLSKLIAQYSKKAQYVLISHNDSVIVEADQVYGVSMQKNGISKVTSLKL
ncbi:MAG: LAGLIDADG family homing endonuclease [Nanoarchaeota archaeon]